MLEVKNVDQVRNVRVGTFHKVKGYKRERSELNSDHAPIQFKYVKHVDVEEAFASFWSLVLNE